MTCCGSKNDFCKKNQKLVLLALKCKPTPVLAKSVEACVKFKIYLQRLPQQNETGYANPRWCIIYVGCFCQFFISRFGSCLQKNPISILRKWKNHFSWDKTKISLHGVPCHSKGHACIQYGLVLTNYVIVMPDLGAA
jgi:hypothetical protein